MKSKHNIIFFIIIILIFVFSAYAYSYNNGVKNYSTGPNLTSSDRVLIFAPHPDDETLSSAGLIRYCIDHNIPVHVVVITNGGKGKLGQIRHLETLNATAKLGLSSQNITFLDYPQVVNRLFNENWDANHAYSDGTVHNSFAYQRNSTYCGESLEANIESMINEYDPTVIIYPAADDGNTDHWGTSAFIDYAVNKMNFQTKMYDYLVHDDVTLWPFPRSYFPQGSLLPPSFLANQTNWFVFPLNNSLKQYKYDAVNSYKSQIKKDPVFLRSYIRQNELFAVDKNISIEKQNTTTDYNNSNDFPPTIYHDPVGDVVNGPNNELYSVFNTEKNYDISDVGFEVNNNSTWISVKTNGGISKNGIYMFHILGYGEDGISRIDFEVANGKASFYMPSSNSIFPSLTVRSDSSGIVVGIPAMNSDVHMFMVDVESSNGTQDIDRTGYFNVNVL